MNEILNREVLIGIFSQIDLVVQVCLIGFGILIAIYTLVYPKIEEIMDSNAKKIIALEKDFDEKRKQYQIDASKKDREKRWSEIEDIKNKIDDEWKPPPEVFIFFLFAMGGFGLPIVIISLNILNLPILNNIAGGIPYFVCGGILMTLLIFISIFVRLHSLIMANFDEKVKKIRELTSERYISIKRPKK